jgi:hypothetical protein
MRRALLVVLFSVAAAGCLPGTVTHYSAKLAPVALCDINQGDRYCQPPENGGDLVFGSLSVDERADETRVYFRGDTLVGKMDGQGHLVVDVQRDALREQSGCLTRQRVVMDVLHDDPGFGIRQELRGTYEESNTAEGDPQQCGRNVPYGQVTRYKLVATETSQP